MNTLVHKQFYQFLGIHSFLIGLFPFFVPVFLWQLGLDLAQIAFFIAITGTGFVFSLWIWDRAHKRINFQHIIARFSINDFTTMDHRDQAGHIQR